MNTRRPKPRKIAAASESEDDAPKVIRPKKPTKLTPTTTAGAGSKPKKPLRLSFAPGAATTVDEDEPAFVPKKSLLSQKATARNVARRELPMEVTPRQEQVSYSSEYLAALKAEQNEGGPKEGDVLTITDDVDSDISMREVAAVAVYDPTPAIPDAAMVRHLKQRRAERKGMPKAPEGEEDFISLGGGAKKEGGRLQPVEDDDELATFIEDAEKPILSNTRRARREAEERRRRIIAEAIAGSSESESSSGEEEFADGQIRAGAGGQRKGFDELLEEMPAAGSVPGIEEVVRRLGGLLGEVQGGRARVQGMLAEVGREKKEISEREGVLKERLNEAGVAYERLKGEMGLGGMQEEEAGMVKPRGLESFGTPIRGSLGGTPIRGE